MQNTFLFLFLGLASAAAAQNAGVGTAAPAARLHVVSGASEVLRVEANDPYVCFFDNAQYRGYLWYDGSRMEPGTVINQPVVIRAAYNDVAHFTSEQRVGIKTAAPTETLDVAGNINLRGVLKIDGNAGTLGQVYVTGVPSLNP